MLAPGTRLGHYTIVSFLAAGGMGEVYVADDTILLRRVAIKTVPEHLVADRAALRRFESEARALAALSHPNILAIHEFGQMDGIAYAVEELLEGETLRERMARAGPLSWKKACEIAAAIADGLAAAHAKGIVHRDLKPENVYLTSDGRTKILDFGLARLLAPDSKPDASTAAQLTTPGIVMGTLHYMAPEQLRGEEVDQTADIFSFGCVLYEMITARRPFARVSAAETISAILSDQPPDLSLVPSSTPQELGHVIQSCLEKNRHQRLQSARDLALQLRALGSPSAVEPRVARSAGIGRRRWLVAGVAAVLLVAAVSGFISYRRDHMTASVQRIASVAVLPFENASGDSETEYLSDGITEGLINNLAKLPQLRVLARTTSFAYKKKVLDPQPIGRELGVDAVVMGKVVLHGDALVVQADLVDVRTLSQLWGDRYEQHSRDLVEVQQTIAGELSRALRPDLTRTQQRQISSGGTENPEAYSLYLRGRFEFAKRNADAVRQASAFFRSAIALDPRFALAYSALADADLVSRDYAPSADTARDAMPSISRALELVPDLPEAHASLGLARLQQWVWPEAERELRTAISLNPNYASAHQWLAAVLEATGRREESLRELQRAQVVDPLSPVIYTNLSRSLARDGRCEEAVAAAQRSLELNDRFGWGYLNLAFAYDGLGQYPQALAAIEKLKQNPGFGPWADTALAIVYAHSGRTVEPRLLSSQVAAAAANGSVSAMLPAMAYAAQRDDQQALAWLRKAIEQRDFQIIYWKSAGAFRHLRGSPQYEEILRRTAAGG